MIDAPALTTWLTELSLELPIKFVRGPRVPEFVRADVIGVVTMLAGPGEALDGLGDNSSFQVRMISREFNLEALRKSAFQVDGALRFGDYPADLWGTRVVSVQRSGGGPAEDQEDELDRVAYVCSYVVLEIV